jgi:hypothetical protein
MSLKQEVEYWIDINNIEYISVENATPGSKNVKIQILNKTITSEEFINKYKMIETKSIKGYFTKDNYSDFVIHVSVKRIK